MVNVLQFDSYVILAVAIAVLGVKVFAFVSSLLFPTESYRAADKLTKPAWCAILGLGVACQILFLSPLNFINLAFTIGALVYLADVRPALASLSRR
jgi:hypothetical protein